MPALCQGSSPLARGKSALRMTRGVRRRFIPTRAGKIYPPLKRIIYITVHPHSRGENHDLTNPENNIGGSSPLARGK
mgnify:CR=1 FL=1